LSRHLSPVIETLDEKCVNCRDCVAACPVKTCIDVAGQKPSIRAELCIGCGSCIIACSHGARKARDDSAAFFAALDRKDKLVAIVAPAVAAHFPGESLRLNSWLKAAGVEAIFDLAYGAESALRSFVDFLEAAKPELVIAQSCPAVVAYLELHRPELLPMLAPTDTPMLRTMKLIAERSPELARHAIAVISPCVSKRREFDKTDKLVYNVTIESLVAHLHRNEVRLADYPEREFDGPRAGSELLLASPGGLKASISRDAPGLIAEVTIIEGPRELYPYLSNLPLGGRANAIPLIVDCLNCERGCNGGTGTGAMKTTRATYSPQAPRTR
jgi:iron only hydrogenase large subunit-like protein